MTEIVTIGDATLYHGDCLEILPDLPQMDLVLVDPPYGIGEAAGKNASRTNLALATDYGDDDWDDAPLDLQRMSDVIAAGREAIVWGGNYYHLCAASKWLVWDKQNGNNDFADCELAWTTLPGAVRIFRHMWNGMLRASEPGPRVHPTQKPVALMRWCLQQAANPQSVVDPCMGSGPVGIACVEREIKYVGIERERKYFDIACERIENAKRQIRLFGDERVPEQTTFHMEQSA